jgi:hypothetical protein
LKGRTDFQGASVTASSKPSSDNLPRTRASWATRVWVFHQPALPCPGFKPRGIFDDRRVCAEPAAFQT